MNKKYVIAALIAIVAISIFAGCVDAPSKGDRAKMLDTQPTKTLTESNERKIFMDYLEQVNNPNNIQFIYLLSLDGHVIYRSTVMGKVISATKSSEPYERESYADVSSSESLNNDYAYRKFAGYIAGTKQLMNPSGMFGHDTPGAIWMDPEGNYYEWHNGPYFISSKPLKIEVPVLRNTDVDTELERKVTEMRNKLNAGGSLSPEDKEYLMNN